MNFNLKLLAIYLTVGVFFGVISSLIIKVAFITGAGFMPAFIYGLLLIGKLISGAQKMTHAIKQLLLFSYIIMTILSIAGFVVGYIWI